MAKPLSLDAAASSADLVVAGEGDPFFAWETVTVAFAGRVQLGKDPIAQKPVYLHTDTKRRARGAELSLKEADALPTQHDPLRQRDVYGQRTSEVSV